MWSKKATAVINVSATYLMISCFSSHFQRNQSNQDSISGFRTESDLMKCYRIHIEKVCVCVCTFLPPGEHVSGGGVLVMFRGLEPQLEGEEPRILVERHTDGCNDSETRSTFSASKLMGTNSNLDNMYWRPHPKTTDLRDLFLTLCQCCHGNK